jgi:C1A family cysteine protease
MKASLANYGPQVVAIYASTNLQNYASGVLKDTTCYSGNCNQVNHAVVLVGYGTDSTHGDYWLLQNSWVSF